MREFIDQMDLVLENRIRLAIMSILSANDRIDFNSLKSTLNLTDGNLASHLGTLEKNEYIAVHKKFVGRKPLTTYSATAKGRRAFSDHLNALEQFIRMSL